MISITKTKAHIVRTVPVAILVAETELVQLERHWEAGAAARAEERRQENISKAVKDIGAERRRDYAMAMSGIAALGGWLLPAHIALAAPKNPERDDAVVLDRAEKLGLRSDPRYRPEQAAMANLNGFIATLQGILDLAWIADRDDAITMPADLWIKIMSKAGTP